MFAVQFVWWWMLSGARFRDGVSLWGGYSQLAQWVIDFVQTWHKMVLLMLDLALFFVLSQPLSRNRASPMHVPTELAYVPVVIAILFVVPAVIMRSSRTSSMHNDIDTAYGWLFTLLTCGSWVVFMAILSTQDDYSPPISMSFALLLFGILAFVYATPITDSVVENGHAHTRAGDWHIWVSLAVLKVSSTLDFAHFVH